MSNTGFNNGEPMLPAWGLTPPNPGFVDPSTHDPEQLGVEGANQGGVTSTQDHASEPEPWLQQGVQTGDVQDDAAAVPDSDVDALDGIGKEKIWVRRHQTGLLLGVAAVSFLVDAGHNIKRVVAEVPWAGPALGVTDAVLVGSVAVMATSVGHEVDWRHVYHIKRQYKEILSKANESKVYQGAFWVSTAAGLGFFAILSAAVVPNFPVKSWGLMVPFVADLGGTVALRVLGYDYIKKAKQKKASVQDD